MQSETQVLIKYCNFTPMSHSRNSQHFTWSLITPMKEPLQNDDSRLEKIE